MEMEPIHILSTMPFPDAWLGRVRALSPRLVVAQHPAAAAGEVPPELWERVEVLYTGLVPPDPARTPRLRWVQLDTSGVDHILRAPIWRSDIAITTLNGVAPTNMAEFALAMMLAFARHMRRILDHQLLADWPSPAERWNRFMPLELRGATVGIVGYGSIGQEIGRMARAFGMRVLGLRRGGAKAEAYQIPGLPAPVEPDLFYTPERLNEMLAASDYVVLIVPYTSATHHMIGEAAFRAMKPGSFLINIARGGVVDEAALVRALREGWIAGAALDVFEQEPLPPDSPLWRMENVIVSPHVAGYTPHYYERVFDLFADNLRRYMAGELLLNLADREREY
jgi:phosphoglycerate dehydrogenase-like enzyme